MYYYTYKIVLQKGSLAEKCYYGQHTTDNLLDGYCGSGILVRKYYKKYGKGRDSYRMYIQKFCNNKEELNQAEKELVSKHLDKDYCLNIAEGGHGGFTGKRTEEQKKKMSVAAKASMTPERRAKISATMKANQKPKHQTEETKSKISAARKGIKFTEEHRSKISAAMKGHKATEETRAKMSAAGKGKHVGGMNPAAKPTTIQNILTNEIITFGCEKEGINYLSVSYGTFRRFKEGLPTTVPQLKNYRVISSDIREVV